MWGTPGIDFKGIEEAASWIGSHLVRWGRVNVTQTKEKYGTARVYLYFGWHQFHSITHPRYVFNQYPKWLWNLDCTVGSKLIGLMNPIIIPYQQFLYKRAYKLAIKKWPHLRLEILNGADYPELLEELSMNADQLTKRLISLVEQVQSLELLLEQLSEKNDLLREDNQQMYEVLERYASSSKPLSGLEAKDVLARLQSK